jgi:hypothetical protein
MESNEFDFKKFSEDSKQALLDPKGYFGTFSPSGGLGLPVIKALIYGAIAGIIYLLWSIMGIGAVGGMFGGGVGIMAFFGSLIGALLGLFIGAVIILLLVAIANGKTAFEPIVHVSAALLVIMPVTALLTVFSGIHWMLGAVLSLAVNLYALWMLYNAMTLTLNARVETTKIIMYVLGGLLILFFFIGMGTRRASRNFMRDFEQYNMDFSQLPDRQNYNKISKEAHTDFFDVQDLLDS